MDITIRQENLEDIPQVQKLIEKAFENVEHSDGSEPFLVEKLRKSKNFIPRLSLVASGIGNEITGHILFTPIEIVRDDGSSQKSLALGPVSVLPTYQNKGVGGLLIKRGHDIAKELGFTSIILLGHPTYYPKFGYKPASLWNIKAPMDVPDEAFMAIELYPNALADASGCVKYPPEFGI
ncbi:GNAT family N-acetyltransferase [Bdellovibrio bacteriovorus]|uniref:GNAT family N-acetyltransferase n=1 Tax=Bdellovibrio bacteriovorus TaxID=959 RepID=UPI0035A71C4C